MRKAPFARLPMFGATAQGQDITGTAPYPQIQARTTLGTVVLKRDGPRAPASVTRFLEYVREGSCQASFFHRVIPAFMVGGRALDTQFGELPASRVIRNESGNECLDPGPGGGNYLVVGWSRG